MMATTFVPAATGSVPKHSVANSSPQQGKGPYRDQIVIKLFKNRDHNGIK